MLETRNLSPGFAIYYTWQDPIRDRNLYWTSPDHLQQTNRLREVTPHYSHLFCSVRQRGVGVFMGVADCSPWAAVAKGHYR